MLGRDHCLPHDTPNSLGISGNVFESLLAPNESLATFFANSGSLAVARRGEWGELERHTQNFARTFSTWNPPQLRK